MFAKRAVHGIRRMHPDEIGDFVAAWLRREDDRFVKRLLYRTLMYQSNDHHAAQAPAVIAEAIEDLRIEPSHITRKAIIRVIGRTAHENDAARLALRDQIAVELRERMGLYSIIGDYLSASDIRLGLDAAQQVAQAPTIDAQGTGRTAL